MAGPRSPEFGGPAYYVPRGASSHEVHGQIIRRGKKDSGKMKISIWARCSSGCERSSSRRTRRPTTTDGVSGACRRRRKICGRAACMHARVSGQSGGHLAPSDLAAITGALKFSRDKRLKSFGVISRVKRERRHISLLGDQRKCEKTRLIVVGHLSLISAQSGRRDIGSFW